MAHWTAQDIPSQGGRSAVVTGTGGLGYQDALALARAGAEVIVAGRNPQRGGAAVQSIKADFPKALVRFEIVDLANLDSITAFGRRMRASLEGLDILINNAAVMAPPKRHETADGHELQFGTNYLGHFALTAQLMPLLRKGKLPRVVTLSSVAARTAKINLADLNSRSSYKTMDVYGQSKLACLMFALELQRRSEAAGWGVASMAAHPGISRTDLLPNGAGRWSAMGIMRTFLWFMFQPAAQGALPTLYAATSSDAKGGVYYGPDRMSEMRGYPAIAKIPPQALETEVATKLWDISEKLTHVSFAPQPQT